MLDSVREAIVTDKDPSAKKSEGKESQNMQSEESSVLMSKQGIALKKFLDQCLPRSPTDRVEQICVGMIRSNVSKDSFLGKFLYALTIGLTLVNFWQGRHASEDYSNGCQNQHAPAT